MSATDQKGGLEDLAAPNGDAPTPAPAPEPDAPAPGWKRDKQNREYTTREGRKGPIYRKGDETVDQAIERDKRPKDEKPRRKRPAGQKQPPPPKKIELREIEAVLAEAFAGPAMVCAAMGDEWAANHFATQAPRLARNLVVASEHNAWLRRQLEAAATGGDSIVKIMSLVGLGTAVFGYVAPPVIYWFSVPVSDATREMFGNIPKRNADPPAQPLAAAA